MKSMGFGLALLFFFCGWGMAQPTALSTTFNQITSVTPVDEGKLLITQYKGDYKAKLYGLDKDSVLHRFIHEGKGPGESMAIKAVDYDEKKQRFTFFSRDHRWIQTDINGELLQEKSTSIFDVSHICSAPDDAMLVFTSVSVPVERIENNDPFPASYLVNMDQLKTLDSLVVTPRQLALNEIENVTRTNAVRLDLIGHRIDENRILLTYDGSKYLFLFKGQELIKRVPAEVPGNFGIRISERNGRVGTQAAGVFTHLQQLSNGTLLFSMGNTHQELPFGAVYVMVSDQNRIMVAHERIYNGFGNVSGGYNHIIAGDERIWFSEFYFTGYSLYREALRKVE